jgi:hypothetical protein
MKTMCASIGASLLVLAIAVLTVAMSAAIRPSRRADRPMRLARTGVAQEAGGVARPAREASSRSR